MEKLPTELIIKIVKFLSENDKKNLSMVSTELYEVIRDVDGFWLKLDPMKVKVCDNFITNLK